MQISEKLRKYLSGEEFSPGGIISLATASKEIIYRIDYLESIARNKSVIHVGCVDHIPLIKQKIASNTWLHKRLSESSEQCLGVDTNEEGIRYLQSIGYDNAIPYDLTSDHIPAVISGRQWDYLLLGEVLEHINNPVFFLETIRKNIGQYVSGLVITVPNAFAINNILNLRKHVECINTDHRFWFTPFTLAKVVHESGLHVNEILFCHNDPVKSFRPSSFLLRKYPEVRSTIVLRASIG